SRIDVMIDPLLDAMAEKGGADGELARSLRGKAAVASAKLAYEIFQQRFGEGEASDERGQRYAKLRDAGAKVQRLLWASTGTKDPTYPDTKYVEPLIGEDTINTMPLDTLNAYRDHGDPAARVTDGLEEARRVVAELSSLGIELDEVSHKLEEEGIGKFVVPFRELMKAHDGEPTWAMAYRLRRGRAAHLFPELSANGDVPTSRFAESVREGPTKAPSGICPDHLGQSAQRADP